MSYIIYNTFSVQGVKAEVPHQRELLQQLNEHCSEYLDSSTGGDRNSPFMISLQELNDTWVELLAKVSS